MKTGHALNEEIKAFIAEKDATNEPYNAKEIEYILAYSGSGGKANQGANDRGLLDEYYTPDYVAELMWELAIHYGFKPNGTVLEPSCATGNLIKFAPDYKNVVGFEVNPVSARIAEIAYEGATIYRGHFETAFLRPPRNTVRIDRGFGTWLKTSPFDLVIGNPPYGVWKNQYSSYFSDVKFLAQIEVFFIYAALQLLKTDGLLVYLSSKNFLSTGDKYQKAKVTIGRIADLVDAYRLPPVMENTAVPVDIFILRKK